jgi:hypothetical protein
MQSVVLKPEQYPEYIRLVRFKDLNNPRTVEGVHPMKLEEYFGAGVSVKEISIEMTDEAVSQKVDRYFSKEFKDRFEQWWTKASPEEKMEKFALFQFKVGATK